MTSLNVHDEYSRLEQVIIGQGVPYQRDKTLIAGEMDQYPFIPDTARKNQVLALTYPTEDILQCEFADFRAVLEKNGIEVLFADTEAAYSFDYTCPRDIGFVVGNLFIVANMSVHSRADEYRTIELHLQAIPSSGIVRPPPDCLLEGGDVILLDARTLLVGFNQRSNRRGAEFLQQRLATEGYRVIPVAHSQLHLDCCLNPLGKGHLLIHPASLDGNSEEFWRVVEDYIQIEVNALEREHLATNVLSIGPNTIIARDHPECVRVNRLLESAGYIVEAIRFDGVPATGGSFRCASLPLTRTSVDQRLP